MISWELWQNRNDYVWKVKYRPDPVIVSSALGFLARWKSARAQCLAIADPPSQSPPHMAETRLWLPQVQCRCSVFTPQNSMGFGYIVCDNFGALVVASNGTVPGFFTPHVAKAIGMREALIRLKQHGFSRIEIEYDSLIVSALQSSAPDSSLLVGLF